MRAEAIAMEPYSPDDIQCVETKVKWFNPGKGFGFLEPVDDTTDIFMHFSVLEQAGFRYVYEGDEVTCEVGPGRQGRQVLRILQVRLNRRDGQKPEAHQWTRPEESNDVIETLIGEVKWFNPYKGFGFLQADDAPDQDIFLHASVLRRLGLYTVEPGCRVQMQVLASDRGKEAREIILLD